MMRFFIQTLFVLTFAANCVAQSDVVISQYIETNSGSTPKGIEIFNVSGSAINFATSNLQIRQGTNGAACTAVVTISSGTLAADEVWVIGTSDLTAYAGTNGTDLSGTTTFSFAFNGDDALSVYLGGVLQDMFGVCGSDPGSAWSGGGASTANNNLQLKDGICDGDTDGWTDPSTRFDQIANGSTMTGFGNPPASCGSSESIMTSAISGSPFCVGNGVTASVSVPYTITGTFAGTNDFRAELSDASGSFASPTTIGSLSNTSGGGTISATIPASVTAGTGYRIRVVGSDPATTGADNASDLVINNFEAPSALAASCGNGEASVTWTNPGCFHEVILVASSSAFTAALPTGDGSSYTASLAFGSGTAFDGGSVVYKGTATASGTITALSNGTAYNFKIFARHGTNWVAGSVESCTPSAITECLNDDFNSGYGNWTGGSGTYQNTGAGITGNGTGFNDQGDDIITTTFLTDPQEVVFWLSRSSSTENKTFSIEYSSSSSGPWTSAQDILVGSTTTTFQEFTVPLNLSGDYYLRFHMSQRSGGSYYLDDVVVSCGSTPSITVNPSSLSGFTYVVGAGPSGVQTFTVEGSDLAGDITITAPTNYEISTSNSPFSASSPITLSQVGGSVSTTTIYVRLAAGLSVGTYNSQNIVCASSGAISQNVTCNGDVTAVQTITTGTVTGSPFCVGNGATASVNVPYTITGSFAATNDFEAQLSDASGNFASPTVIGTLSNTNANGTVSGTIPASTPAGTGYRIRVVGNDPATNGSDNGTDLTVENFAAPTGFAVSCGNAEASASWTNPTCFDEVMLVATDGSFTSALPTGDGTAYTANLAFGSGTAFDGGSVVFKGTFTSSGTITGLTNGTLYSFKIFARTGTTWIAGSVLSCTPVSQCGSESFTNVNAPGGSYGAGSYTGDNSVSWSYSGARTVTSTYNITGTSIGFADSGTRSVSATSTNNGVGDITFSVTSYFTGGTAADRTIEVYVNGTLYGTYTLAAMSTVYTHTVTANEPGTVSIEFRSTGSRQVVIDDISWTCAGTLPTITVTPLSLSGLDYQFNSGPSAVQSFTVEGTDLTNDITVALPSNYYEISTSNSPFSAAGSAITLTQSGGTVSTTTIYVRLQSSLSVGTYNGETLDCSSSGATTKTVTFNGEVTAIPISVTTGAVLTSPFDLTSCSDTETGTVAFTSTGTFNGGNVYSVELSDATGDFGSPISIGSITSTANSGTINFTIPAGISGGTGYKMRVLSSNPSFTGTESSAITITTACTSTFLEGGDLAILAFNTNVDGSFGFDEISFVSFVPINPGTVIDFTDNAYEKCGTPNGWGVSEGWFRMVRTSTVLPAGEVITVKVEYGNAIAVAPDANWSISKPQPAAQGNFDLNADGEQLFIMSGGNVGGVNSSSPTSDGGTYSGYFLYGFNTKGNIWTPVCGNAAAGGTKNSAKPIDFDCFLVWPTAQADKNKYTGPMTSASVRDWLYRINTPANWTGYTSNANYEAGPDFKDYNGPSQGRTISISAGGFSNGLWTGEDNEDWHNCRNWQSLRVPDSSTDVSVPNSPNNPMIMAPNIGECNTIIIQTDLGAKVRIQDTAKLKVFQP